MTEYTDDTSTPLDYSRELTAEAVIAPDHYLDVLALTFGLTHKIDEVSHAPYIFAQGAKNGGKTQILRAAMRLAGGATHPIAIVNQTAPAYVSQYRINEHHTPLLDEVHQMFGLTGEVGKGGRFRGLLNQGNDRDTAFSETQDSRAPSPVVCFGVVFMAGQGKGMPDDMAERSIFLRMTQAPEGVTATDFGDDVERARFAYAGQCLESWAKNLPRIPQPHELKAMNIHPKLTGRRMDVWGGLFGMAIVADLVSEFADDTNWLDRCLSAFKLIELDRKPTYTPQEQIQLDYLQFAAEFSDKGVPSGAFSAWAHRQLHTAYREFPELRQFQQFASVNLGPTAAFRAADGTPVRGWAGSIHRMNLERATRTYERVTAEPIESEKENWGEDF